jgi:hypothetical protein
MPALRVNSGTGRQYLSVEISRSGRSFGYGRRSPDGLFRNSRHGAGSVAFMGGAAAPSLSGDPSSHATHGLAGYLNVGPNRTTARTIEFRMNMIRLTKERQIAPYVWVHPDEER